MTGQSHKGTTDNNTPKHRHCFSLLQLEAWTCSKLLSLQTLRVTEERQRQTWCHKAGLMKVFMMSREGEK